MCWLRNGTVQRQAWLDAGVKQFSRKWISFSISHSRFPGCGAIDSPLVWFPDFQSSRSESNAKSNHLQPSAKISPDQPGSGEHAGQGHLFSWELSGLGVAKREIWAQWTGDHWWIDVGEPKPQNSQHLPHLPTRNWGRVSKNILKKEVDSQ